MNITDMRLSAMVILCVAAATTVVACGSVDGGDAGDLASEELVAEAADEVFSCGWSTGTADAARSTLYWNAESVGDTYSALFCPRFVVEFTQYDDLVVSWNDQTVTESDCERMRLIYTGYTYSGGAWIDKGTFHGHGNWDLGQCFLVPDTGYSHLVLGSGTKYRIAASAYEQSCTDTCYLDFKRVKVESVDALP